MKQMMSVAVKAVSVVSLCVLAACSTTSPDVIKPGDAQRLSQVADGVVLNVRPVVVEGSQSGIGGGSGAVIGGIAGAGSTSNSRGSAMAGVAGAVVGAPLMVRAPVRVVQGIVGVALATARGIGFVH